MEHESNNSRRAAVSKILGASLGTAVASTISLPNTANAYDASTPVGLTENTESSVVDESFVPAAKITHKVTLNVRISRADGTFYIRDDPPDTIPTSDNQVFYGQLILGLFGQVAPTHVERFLTYADVLYTPVDDTPAPSYARSLFQSLDQTNGLLQGGYIPGLHLTTLGGGSALEYGGKILGAPLWIEKKDAAAASEKISHSVGRGLLTHRNLEVLPVFGVTTRPASGLDGTHTVFGQILPTESSKAFLNRVIDLPTYSTDRPTIPVENVGGGDSRAVGEVASSVYSFQKEFFRGAAKSFGDTRLSNVYEGKILRRVEVTSVSVEKI